LLGNEATPAWCFTSIVGGQQRGQAHHGSTRRHGRWQALRGKGKRRRKGPRASEQQGWCSLRFQLENYTLDSNQLQPTY